MMTGKTALIHDWLNGMRGGEKVLEEICGLFPNSDVFTLFYEPEKVSETIKTHPVYPASINRFTWIRRRYKYFLPIFPEIIENFNLNKYELVISSSHCVAKGIIPHPEAMHISYIHSPMRYIWDQYHVYFGRTHGWRKAIIRRQVNRLRMWDTISSARVSHFVANSRFVQQRIWKYYRRESEVIHPPVDTEFYRPHDNPSRDFFLTVSALVPYKGIDLLVDAFSCARKPLVVVGKGPEEKRLKKYAGKNIVFRKDVSAEELKSLYQNARAFVFAGVEDFGIAFVESLACGTPVLAFKAGGVLDIVDDESGILFPRQTTGDIMDALSQLSQLQVNAAQLHKKSLRFSRRQFSRLFSDFVESKQ